ncbi:SPOR domain-containing protein [Labilibaculum sp.]|uniref:SPOR domain-containing protein n=1 Tax=Labilibaculum sp. TaxID=2060723 RepID=UPI00356A6800
MVKINFLLILVVLFFSGCKDKKAITPIEKGKVVEQTAKRLVPEISATTTEPETKLTAKQIVENRNSLRYHIVAASYTNVQQAENFKSRMYKKGYPSVVLQQNGKYRVIIQSFNKKETALSELFRLRKLNKTPDLWLLHQ